MLLWRWPSCDEIEDHVEQFPSAMAPDSGRLAATVLADSRPKSEVRHVASSMYIH